MFQRMRAVERTVIVIVVDPLPEIDQVVEEVVGAITPAVAVIMKTAARVAISHREMMSR